MEATFTCPKCKAVIKAGGRNKEDARESVAFKAEEHYQKQHGVTVSPDTIMASKDITVR
jgi:hypothetical protein